MPNSESKSSTKPKINVDFPALLDFLAYLSAIKGRSTLTIKEYRYDLILFFRFYKIHKHLVDSSVELEKICLDDVDNDLLKQITLTDLYAFIAWLSHDKPASTANRSRKIATLRSFFKYHFSKTGILKTNPAAELESPKQVKRQPKYLEIQESKDLLRLAANDKSIFSQRDYCILTLFLNCGLRLAELCNINLTDIKEDTLKVIGKGNKERTVYLNGACMDAISLYLDERLADNFNVKKQDAEALFISRQGNRISHPAVQLMVKKYIKNLGLDPKKYTPHKLRHTAATLMFKYGKVDIRILQHILGHSSVSTTEIYTHLDEGSLHNAAEQNPLANERI